MGLLREASAPLLPTLAGLLLDPQRPVEPGLRHCALTTVACILKAAAPSSL